MKHEKKETRTISARLPKPLINKLNALAKSDDRSVSYILKNIIEKAVQESST